MLHFFDKYGYHKLIFDWYYPEGIVTFDVFAPGWVIFTYPFYKLFGDVKPATFISLILMYILGFIIFWFIGNVQNFSKLETITFYLFYFASPMVVGDYIRQMRLPQMFAWIAFFFAFAIILHYEKKTVNKYIFLLSIPIAMTVLSHQPETVLLAFPVIGLVLVKLIKKKFKEVSLICFALLCGFILSFPWLYTFLKRAPYLLISKLQFSRWTLDFSGGFRFVNISGIIISIAMLIVFIVYISTLKQKIRREKIIFFSPVLFFNFIYLTRLIVFFPILKHLYPDPIIQFIGFFTIFFYFSINKEILSNKLNLFYNISIIIIPILFVIVSCYHTPFFIKPTPEEEESLLILENVSSPYAVVGEFPKTLYQRAIICYGSIYYNLFCADGWYPSQTTPLQKNKLDTLRNSFKKRDCEKLKEAMNSLKIKELITCGNEQCSFLENCLTYKSQKGKLCLFKI